MDIVYSFNIPVCNAEALLIEFYQHLQGVLKTLSDYELIFVNGGSTDRTDYILREFVEMDKRIRVVKMSAYLGYPAAVMTGIEEANGQALVLLDVGSPDSLDSIKHMISEWKAGADVVYGKMKKSERESIVIKLFRWAYYRFMRIVTQVQIPVDVGDFRLIDRRVLLQFPTLRERNRFIRSLVSWSGFRQAVWHRTRHVVRTTL